jgi:hypothetical protein
MPGISVVAFSPPSPSSSHHSHPSSLASDRAATTIPGDGAHDIDDGIENGRENDRGRLPTTWDGANARRDVVRRLAAAAMTSAVVAMPHATSLMRPDACYAATVDDDVVIPSSSSSSSSSSTSPPSSSTTSGPYVRESSPSDRFKYGYAIDPPRDFVISNKPLKTHVDEINFTDPNRRGYSYGITIDPVRIGKISDFGSTNEVAARVVNAELNRDGVFVVTLVKDPTEGVVGDEGVGCYDIEYLSEGKRGKRRYVTRIYVKDGMLYVLTVQSNEDDYDREREMEAMDCLKSFRPL